MPPDLELRIHDLKERLLLMASYAEAAVNKALKALVKRDDDLARQTKEEDEIIDRLEMEIDAVTLHLFEAKPDLFTVRLITMAMKIAHDLERVGDEATTISRRCLELSREPALREASELSRMGRLALAMLKDALDAFVNRDTAQARGVVARDEDVDRLNKHLHASLEQVILKSPAQVSACLNLMVVSKSLERVADHATNIAEMVVYLYEGRDIRHGKT